MSERTRNLLNGKLNGFPGLAAVMLSFGMALAVVAAGGTVLAGCDNLAGADGGDAVVSADGEPYGLAAPAGADPDSLPVFTIASGDPVQGPLFDVKFEILNGGWGLYSSRGIVSTEDDQYIVRRKALAANDFTITIEKSHEGDEYANIRWAGQYMGSWYGFTAKMTLLQTKGVSASPYIKYTIKIDFNHDCFGTGWSIKTKGLYDVQTFNKKNPEDDPDWKDAWSRAEDDEY